LRARQRSETLPVPGVIRRRFAASRMPALQPARMHCRREHVPVCSVIRRRIQRDRRPAAPFILLVERGLTGSSQKCVDALRDLSQLLVAPDGT